MANRDNAQPPISTPDPALKRLDKLVGTWELTGRTAEAKVDNIKGWTTFEWLPGGFFLKVTGEISVGDFTVQSLEIIGYDPATQNFPSQVYSNLNGTVSPYYWNVQGNTVTHWEENAKYTGTFSADGNVLSGGWRPNEGMAGPDNISYDAVMTRVKGSGK